MMPVEQATGIRKWLLAVALLLAMVWMGYHGLYRGVREANDLRVIYASEGVWLHGGNPYAYDQISAYHMASDAQAIHRSQAYFQALYPPSIYPLLAPMGALPWSVVGPMATMISLAALLLSLHLLAVQLNLPPMRRGVLLVLGLAFGPAVTAIAMGQLTLWALAAVLLGWHGTNKGRWLLGGAAMGVGVALKPQMVGAVVLLLPFARQWRCFGVCVLTAALLGAMGAARMSWAGVSWLTTYTDNLDAFRFGGHGDPTAANTERHLLLELPVLLHLVFDDARIVIALSWAAALVPSLLAAWRVYRLRQMDTLAVATVLAASMLPVYHRFYDAVVLLVVVAWLIAMYRPAGTRAVAWWIAAGCCLIFTLPHTGSVVHLLLEPHLPASVTGRIAWQGSVAYHQDWVALILCYALAWFVWRAEPVQPAERPSTQNPA